MKRGKKYIFVWISFIILLNRPLLGFCWQSVDLQNNTSNLAINPTYRPGTHLRDCEESICSEMVVLPFGTFLMGSDAKDENGRQNELPLHRVTIWARFAIGLTPVTQGQWKALMGNNPSQFTACGDDCPVENVSWYDVQQYISRLNQKTGKEYRLPSEAEWEYACRSGMRQEYCGGNSADIVAWHSENSQFSTHPVGTKLSNQWGIFDMSGNVREWVEDCFDSYKFAPIDGTAKTENQCKFGRVLRGGSWFDVSQESRAATRNGLEEHYRFASDGFRVARTLH
ncbi:formylglycine-generating enzyme family protein [Sapientia aquatica]|uniref:Formylglycine-generating enzyme family protein n=1 Tax=Sapientia aquatica TaxID=1549640 RepID=A0A4R5VRI3_9BURK|nr:formylglycine-generating enzyme family protein [Sapientia aquatica]TDK61306.1 formylglycine-generating enzyme family protein [Sapientia aquatica]